MVVGRVLIVAASLVVALPSVSADPVDDANAPLCSTVWSYFCEHPVGEVPQDKDEAVDAASDGVKPFFDVLNPTLCGVVWSFFCAHPLMAPHTVNEPLCSTVWSYFCDHPI